MPLSLVNLIASSLSLAGYVEEFSVAATALSPRLLWAKANKKELSTPPENATNRESIFLRRRIRVSFFNLAAFSSILR